MNDWLVLILGGFGALVALGLLIEFIRECSREACAPTAGPPPNPNVVHMKLPATGREVFTPPLLPDRVYHVRVSGTYEFWRFGGRKADALFYTDRRGNFSVRYDGLSVEGRSVANGTFDASGDRYLHEYTFQVDGGGRRLPVQLNPPRGGDSGGFLSLTIELLPPETLTLRARREGEARAKAEKEEAAARCREQEAQLQAKASAEAEASRREEEAAAQAEARQQQQQEAAQKRQALVRARVADLVLQVHAQRNLLDAEYRAHFIRQNRGEILTKLGPIWTNEYRQLMSHQDLVATLEQQAPQVLRWYEARLEMMVSAERLQVIPPDEPAVLHGPLPLTPHAVPYLEYIVGELYRLRGDYLELRNDKGYERNAGPASEAVNHISGLTVFYLEQLKRYGIDVTTPEQAEEQFQHLRPPQPPALPPPLDWYQQFRERVLAGDEVVANGLLERLQNLHDEKRILSAQRRAAIRAGRLHHREAIDERLAEIRGEVANVHSFLKSAGIPVELKDPREPEKEESRRERFLKLYQEKQQIVGMLQTEGDEETIEHVEGLYAQEQAKLFDADEEHYT